MCNITTVYQLVYKDNVIYNNSISVFMNKLVYK
jgi:hypothetical protein